jgi:hypothetical protein
MFRFLVSLLAGGCWLAATAATGSIGVIRSNGDFRVDGSTVRGNGTLFDGDVIETMDARSVVQLDAVQITLGPDSRAQVYRDRTVLEKGAGLLRDADTHVFEAASLRIAPAARDAVVQVDVEGPGRISVSARSGGALVRNSGGVLVANVRPGAELEFDTQEGAPAGASMAVKIQGVVEVSGGNYFLTDAATHVTYQLKISELVVQNLGKQVVITGSIIPKAKPVGGASQVVEAASVTPVSKATGNGKTGTNTASTGLSTAAKATICGVAVGASVGVIGAVGGFNEEPRVNTTSPD